MDVEKFIILIKEISELTPSLLTLILALAVLAGFFSLLVLVIRWRF